MLKTGERDTNRRFQKEKAQTGIDTLLIFIAIILVAGATAALFLNTEKKLGKDAEQTSSDASVDISRSLKILSVTGNVTPNEKIDHVNLTVVLRSRGASYHLGNSVIHYIDKDVSKDLLYEENVGTDPASSFYVIPIEDPDDSDPVLNGPNDVFKIRIDVGDVRGSNLTVGTQASLEIQPDSGQPARYGIIVPQSLKNEDSVDLS